MPLRDEEKERARPTASPTGAALTSQAATAGGDLHDRTRGDLIIKFAITPPDASPHVEVVGGGLLAPPVVLVTSADGRGSPIVPMAVHTLVKHVLLPSMLRFAHHRSCGQKVAAASSCFPALLRPGGLSIVHADALSSAIAAAVEAGADPSIASAEATRAVQQQHTSQAGAPLLTVCAALRGVFVRVGSSATSDPASACAHQLMGERRATRCAVHFLAPQPAPQHTHAWHMLGQLCK